MAERRLPSEEDYPNNSHAAKERLRATDEKLKKPKVKKVVKGEIQRRKRPLRQRFAEAFGVKEGQGIIDYILCDIIIPTTKSMIVDSIQNGIEMMVYGEIQNTRRGRNGRQTRFAYDRVSYQRDDRYRGRDNRDDREDRKFRSAMYDYEDILLTYDEVEDVITQMVELIDAYEEVTVNELYDMLGVTPQYTFGNYGWVNVHDASYRKVRNGYVLDLPRPILLPR